MSDPGPIEISVGGRSFAEGFAKGLLSVPRWKMPRPCACLRCRLLRFVARHANRAQHDWRKLAG